MGSKATEIFYSLTKDGKCPKCYMQIKIKTSTYEIYKVRFVKMFYIDRNKLGKCPHCKTLIEVDI